MGGMNPPERARTGAAAVLQQRPAGRVPSLSCFAARSVVQLAPSTIVVAGGQIVFDSPEGENNAEILGNRMTFPITISIDFGAPSDRYEYRQYVKGYFKENDRKVSHALAGGAEMSEDEYREDGIKQVFGSVRLGHRNAHIPGISEFYNKPGKKKSSSGRYFLGQDAPGVAMALGEIHEMRLYFRGDIIDTQNQNAVVARREWSVVGYHIMGGHTPSTSAAYVRAPWV